MAFVKYPPETTSEAIDVFNQDVPILHEVIHGDDSAEVLTENGSIPSVSKVLKDIYDNYATINNTGDWQPSTNYAVRDIWHHPDGTWYLVLTAYTSDNSDVNVDLAGGNVGVYQNSTVNNVGLIFESLDVLKSKLLDGYVPTNTIVSTTSYHLGTYKGANKYVFLDAGSFGAIPSPDTGANIPIGTEGKYIKGLFPNGVWIEQFGALPISNFDNSDAIEQAAAYRVCGELKVGFGAFEMWRSVYIPVGIFMEGLAGNRSFRADYSDTTCFIALEDDEERGIGYVEDYLFFLNIDPNGNTNTWVKIFPNIDSGSMKHMCIDGTNRVGGINAFKFGGSYEFENIHSTFVKTLIGKPSLYTDKVKIKRIHTTNRANTTDFLIYLPGLGDGYELGEIAPGFLIDQETICKGIYVGACRGGHATNIINGHHLLQRTTSFEFIQCHIERGSITVKDGNAHIRDGVLYTEDETPVPIILDSDDGVFGNRYEVTVSNVVFDQSMNNRGGFRHTDKPDIVANSLFTLNINNCKRKITNSSNVGLQQYHGILLGTDETTLLPDFNDYSHVLSKSCTIVGHKVLQHAQIAEQFGSFNGCTVATENIPNLEFGGPSDTYYYQVQIIQDPVRALGKNAVTPECSIALTNLGNPAVLTLAWSTLVNRGHTICRVYRGVSSGIYDCVVDVPIISANKFYDVGHSLSGFVWQTRMPAGMGALNGGLNGAISIVDGIIETSTDGIAASEGTWKQGDRIKKRNITPSGLGSKVLTDFIRLTDGSSHTKNTDWFYVNSEQG